MDFTYVRFTPERLDRAVHDWAGTAEFLMEELDDQEDEHVISVPGRSLSLFAFLLACTDTPPSDTPPCLWSSDQGGIRPPDDADPVLLDNFGDTTLLSFLTPQDVAGIATALEANGFDRLVAGADPAAMAEAGVGLVPDRGRRRDFDKTHYNDLARFLAAAAADGHGCLTWEA